MFYQVLGELRETTGAGRMALMAKGWASDTEPVDRSGGGPCILARAAGLLPSGNWKYATENIRRRGLQS